MLKSMITTTALFFALGGPAYTAEPLQMQKDAEGNIHFGNASDPELCCMCQPVTNYHTQSDKVLFSLPSGLTRAISNESVFISADGKAWYCEGVKEGGQLGRKCGLIPPSM